MIYNAVLVSGVQQSNSAIHRHISILFQILSPFRLLKNTEYSSLCYTVGVTYILFHGKFQVILALQYTMNIDHVYMSKFSSKAGFHVSTEQILYDSY